MSRIACDALSSPEQRERSFVFTVGSARFLGLLTSGVSFNYALARVENNRTKDQTECKRNVPISVNAYLWIMDRDRGRVLERQASGVAVKRYRYDRCIGVVEVTEGQFRAARREP